MAPESLPPRLREVLGQVLRALVDARPANRAAPPPPPSSCPAVVRYCRRARRTTGEREVGR